MCTKKPKPSKPPPKNARIKRIFGRKNQKPVIPLNATDAGSCYDNKTCCGKFITSKALVNYIL